MIAAGIGPTEIGLILVAVLLLFGGAQLPKLAKNLGKAQKEFKDGLAAGSKDGESKDSKESAKADDSDS